MLKIKDLYISGGRTKADIRYNLTDSAFPRFSWSLEGGEPRQKGYRALAFCGETLLWDSGFVASEEQEALYAGAPLPPGRKTRVSVSVYGEDGCAGALERDVMNACFEEKAKWIRPQEPTDGRVTYFSRDIMLAEEPREACFYVCGLGYHHILINGEAPDDSLLQPSHTNYAKTVCCSAKPAGFLLKKGLNTVSVLVAEGWRNNMTEETKRAVGERQIEFMGPVMLWGQLEVFYAGGRQETFVTDASWQYSFGPVAQSGIYAGEDYNAAAEEEKRSVCECEGPGGTLAPDILEPVRPVRTLAPADITRPEKGLCVLDFGENIAGVLRLPLPPLPRGHRIEVRFAEELDENGTLFTAPLRGALCRDTYTASGDERDLAVWQPLFTWHGFRYAAVSGLEDCSGAEAVEIHTDLRTGTRFRCGSSLVNSVWEALIRTDENNISSVMTDCPQRDERMGWMNDATGRFGVSPYSFEVGRLYPKIIRDIQNEQRPEGCFTCCCPYYYGMLPADPCCSSFLVAAREYFMRTGDAGYVRSVMPDLERWEDYLLSRSKDHIVDYSWYGDWAGPSYACMGEEIPQNAYTDGLVVSTGFSLYNCLLLRELAEKTGLPAEKYRDNAEKIKNAMLSRWWDEEKASFAGGGMGAQAFALWLGLIPKAKRAAAAENMALELRRRRCRITTGNQLTQPLMEMLFEYGYADDAWEFLCREEYPSFGYMLQNEATTLWERYELKKAPGMNSHSHPMHGNALSVLYTRIAGLKPAAPGWKKVEIKPCLPEKLLSCSLAADTPRGMISVRWAKRFGKKILWAQLPPGVSGTVAFEGAEKEITSGFHRFEAEI